MNVRTINALLPNFAITFLLALMIGGNQDQGAGGQVSNSQFLAGLKRGEFSEVFIDGQKNPIHRHNGEPFVTWGVA